MVGTSKIVGSPIKRKEDPRLITGDGNYTDDVYLRGTVYMAVLRSPHAHAVIRRVDTSRAKSMPEVLAAWTGAEIVARCAARHPLHGPTDQMNVTARWTAATEVANYVGEPVAAVVATSRSAAKDALEQIEVEYDALRAVVDIEEAASGVLPPIHEELGTNVCFQFDGNAGDVDGAFREADGVVSVRLEMPRIVPNPMEARAVVASFERGPGALTVWDTSQGPHNEREELAEVLGLPENKVRVIALDVGGGFGCKMALYPEAVISSLFSIELGRPVRWTEERQENFVSTIHGRGHVEYVDAAYKQDGTLLGMRLRYFTDLGAYCTGSAHSVTNILLPPGVQGVYTVRNLAWTNTAVYTNKVPFGPYRGYTRSPAAYLTERVMDVIAGALSMDPAEVRRRNLIPTNAFPYRTPTGQEYDSGDYEGALARVLEMAEYGELRNEQRGLREQGELMGIGMAITVESAGYGPSSPGSSRPGYETATVRVDRSGRLTVFTGASPHGQGLETTLAQLVADDLGVPFEHVEVVHGDTSMVPRGNGTFASRSLVVGGSALLKASGVVKLKATQVAAALLQVDPHHVSQEGGRYFAEDIPDRYVTWAEVAEEAYQARHLPADLERGLEATAFWEPKAYTFGHCANVVAVRVDRGTGEVTLTKYFLVDDCGVAINPMVVDGQLHGGIAQCPGQALMEGAVWDEDGQLLNGSYLDYALPLAEEFPTFTIERTETPSPHNPMGAKGGGEMGTIAATTAIVNAVVDALSHLGVTHIDIPITSEKVWRILQEKGAAG